MESKHCGPDVDSKATAIAHEYDRKCGGIKRLENRCRVHLLETLTSAQRKSAATQRRCYAVLAVTSSGRRLVCPGLSPAPLYARSELNCGEASVLDPSSGSCW